jgi:hypothetical protein
MREVCCYFKLLKDGMDLKKTKLQGLCVRAPEPEVPIPSLSHRHRFRNIKRLCMWHRSCLRFSAMGGWRARQLGCQETDLTPMKTWVKMTNKHGDDEASGL